MRIIGLLSIGLLLLSGATMAQSPSDSYQRVGTMSDLMVSMVYPPLNEILLLIHRGGPASEDEWVKAGRSAVMLAESGNILVMRNPDSTEWVAGSRALVDVGAAAYRVVQSRDQAALAALSGQLDASCVNCHTRFRPDVHPQSLQ